MEEDACNNSFWHPAVQMMNSLGCKSESKVFMAIHVYLDLTLVKAMWDTKAIYSTKLDIIYITGKWSKNAETQEIVIPTSASASISPDWLTEVQNELCGEKEKKMITLAFVEGDSSICYYQACGGLNPPDSPETVQKRRRMEERKQCRTSEMMQEVQNMIRSALDDDVEQVG
ncbi:hypothetical protein J437_LFUL008437 [Ladona fulva]|uniref:tRNA-splicing endonuclease subunit Sen15 domain-containing protein n=1 Tax=Ladona fulva TaxID=123851 RepID=A0A8K0NZA9_LADFU|nr:hypothetical protein J437_LFUL008437 [Ladona fulva]